MVKEITQLGSYQPYFFQERKAFFSLNKLVSTLNFCLRVEDTRSKLEMSARWSISAWLQRKGGRSYVILPRRASQFDPAIDKERKLISN